MIAEAFLGYAITFALVMSRVAGYVATSPFPGENVPATARIGFVIIVSYVSTMIGKPAVSAGSLDLSVAFQTMLEFGCGALIGVTFRLMLAAVDAMGDMISHSASLSTASILNPELGRQESALSRALGLFALLLALESGVHRTLLSYLMESFRVFPVGSHGTLAATVPLFVELSGKSLAVGMRLAMPVIAVGLSVQVVLALIARAAPSLQIFNVGFSVMLMSGVAAVFVSLKDIGLGILGYLSTIPSFLDRVFVELMRR